MTGDDWKEPFRRKLRAFGPRLPQQCQIEDDFTLGSFTFCVVFWTIFFMVVYTLWFLTLTEVQPASISNGHLKSPEVLFVSSNRKLGDYCDRPQDYSCKAPGWSVSPKGCAFVSEAYIPTIPLAQATGDGVFIPTLWSYEEVTVRPADAGNCTTYISSHCIPTPGHGGPPGSLGQNYYCSCKKKESFFIPWVIEQNMIFSYQMHLQIPDLDVMAAEGVFSPSCQGYLKSDQSNDPPPYTRCKGQNDVEGCLRKFYHLSSMPCQVRLKKGQDFQGVNHYGQRYTAPRYKDLDIDYFWSDLWGGWHLNVSRVLNEVADFSASAAFENPNPFTCSFLSTGGSLLLQHFVEPFSPRVWYSWWSFTTPRFWAGIWQKVVCRIGLLSVINWHHDWRREWPCFQVKIDITYSPLTKYAKTETDVDISQAGVSTTKTKQHRGLSILAQGGVGTVRQFSWTAIILGMTSLTSLWAFRLVILGTVISWECLCGGVASGLYRKALTQTVSNKRMVSAWVCRSLSALEAADRLANKESQVEAARKITEHLKTKCPKANEQKVKPFLEDVIEGMICDSLEQDRQDSPTDAKEWAAGWWLANESRGDVTSEDITKLVDAGKEGWKDIIDPSFEMVTGHPTLSERGVSEDFSARGMQLGYVQMRCSSEDHVSDDNTDDPESSIDPQAP